MRARALAVRNRIVVGERYMTCGGVVHCPRRGTSVASDECLTCPHSAGAAREPGRPRLLCIDGGDDDAAPRHSELASPAHATPLSEAMTADLVCASPDVSVDDLVDLMLQRDVQVVPIVDEVGRPIGMVWSSDLVDGFDVGSIAADVMRPIALVLPAAETVWRAAALMAREGIRRAPVVGTDGRVVGMVSSLHLTRWLARGGPLEGQG